MAVVAEDPFKDLRGSEEYEGSKPLNEQKTAEKIATLAQIRQLYADHTGEGEVVMTDELRQGWIDTCADALSREPDFWALCVDNAVGLYAYKPPKVLLKQEWFAALYLQGFYDCYATFEEGYDDFFEAAQEAIVQAAEMNILTCIQSAEDELEAANIKPKLATTVDPVSKEMIALFELVKQDKVENASRNKLMRTLDSLGPTLVGMPKSKEVLERYNQHEQITGVEVLDQFGHACLKMLKEESPSVSLVALPDLTEDEKTALDAATSIDFVIGETGQQRSKSKVEKTQKRSSNQQKSNNILKDPPAIIKWLDDNFRDYPDAITYPCCPALSVPVFDVQHVEFEMVKLAYGRQNEKLARLKKDQQDKEKKDAAQLKQSSNSFKNIWRRSSSFITGRMLSEREAEQDLPDARSLTDKCVEEVKGRIKNNVYFYKPLFKDLATKLGSMVEREKRAQDEDIDSTWQTYSEMGFYDNWFHVRKLLQALAFYLGDDTARTKLGEAEMEICQLLAMIQGASSTPLAWMLTLDHVLRNVWRLCQSYKPNAEATTSKKGKGKAIATSTTNDNWIRIFNIFSELAKFAQGAAIYAAVQRFQYNRLYHPLGPGNEGRIKDPDRMLQWFTTLYAFDPRCANPECNRLLPHPSRFKTIKGISEVFSVASRDVRAGKKSVRAFVSTNRIDVYPCFYSCIQSRQPSPVLIVMMFYYSELYHAVTVGCKGARGKRSIAGFA